MEKLSDARKIQVLSCLVEGNSLASTERITGVSKMTVLKTLAEMGEACSAYQQEQFVKLPCQRIELDEIWSFVGCKEGNKERVKGTYQGDIWMWTAICADTKLIPCWYLGDRGGQDAYAFCDDLSKRFAGRIQITSDGWQAYEWAIRATFGEDNVDYAQLVKVYDKGKGGRNFVSSIEKRAVYGNPNMATVSTSYVERSNLMVRMNNKRYCRLTPCYSKKVENHAHQIAINFMAYNYCRKHESLKGRTPAMAAGLADHVWSLAEVVEMINAHTKAKEDATFEHAFSNTRWAAKRNSRQVTEWAMRHPPKSRGKVLPWYLDVNSGGPPED